MTCRSFVSSYHLPKPHTSDQPPSGSSEMDHHEALCWGSAKDSYACWGPSPKHDHCIMQSSPESAISNVLAPARQQSHQRNSWSRSFHGAFPRPWLWHPKEPSEGQQKSPPISHQSLHSPWTIEDISTQLTVTSGLVSEYITQVCFRWFTDVTPHHLAMGARAMRTVFKTLALVFTLCLGITNVANVLQHHGIDLS